MQENDNEHFIYFLGIFWGIFRQQNISLVKFWRGYIFVTMTTLQYKLTPLILSDIFHFLYVVGKIIGPVAAGSARPVPPALS